MVGLVDTWVIGHMPQATHLAAIAIGATIFSFLFWAFGFLRMSTTGLVAQAHGAEDNSQIARIIVRSTAMALLLGSGLILAQSPIMYAAFLALSPPASVVEPTESYFAIRIWSAPATLFIYTATGFLIGTARAKAALGVQLVLNVSNGILNLVFVLGLNMGVSGIALGSLIAEWLAAFVCVFLLLRYLGGTLFLDAITSNLTWHLSKMQKLLAANGYIFVRTLLLLTALAIITRKAAGLGTSELAANQVLMTFIVLISLGLDAFAHAAEALTGAAYGKRSLTEFRIYVKRTMVWAVLLAIVYSIIFWVFGEAIIHILTDIEGVRQAAKSALVVIILMPLISMWGYQYDGIFVGVTEGRGMLITTAIAFTAYILVIERLTDMWGLKGLWLAFLVLAAGRGISQAFYYFLIEAKLKRLQSA